MKLENSKYELAKLTVADIIYDYDLKYPISALDLAKQMDFCVFPYSFFKDKKELFINYSEDGFNLFLDYNSPCCICYNDAKEIETRINFTIAHEIGHIVLNCNDNSEESNSLADFFAAYLLAPVVLIIEKGLNSVEDVRNFFGVSYEMAKNSLDRAKKKAKLQ